ncbi:hypothetical protein B484DRAFT_441089, partial [Ochromonadaceae sp. CCMP2298]
MSAFDHDSTADMEAKLGDLAWLSETLGFLVDSAVLEDMSKAGGLSAQMRRLVVNQAGVRRSYVVKCVKPDRLQQSQMMGGAREALFYQHAHLPGLPSLAHTEGSMETGFKFIILEDLGECMQSGYFFGPGSPLNWGKDLAQETAKMPPVQPRSVVEAACSMAARLHGLHWRSEGLRALPWLRGSGWLAAAGAGAGAGEEPEEPEEPANWRFAQQHAARA